MDDLEEFKEVKPEKIIPSEMEEACFFLDLRVRYMFETDASQYPSDQMLRDVYPDAVTLFFDKGFQQVTAF